jgi:polyisoprenoid-binding protein YceI
MNRRQLAFGFAVLLVGALATETRPQSSMDAQRSVITIHVFKSGVFSTFADNHEVQAPLAEGVVDETRREVHFVIHSNQLKVLDPNLAATKRAEVQSRMLGPEVLDSERFPRIEFHSTQVEPSSNGFHVRGELTLHGQTRPVALDVEGQAGTYRGKCSLKQTDYGMKPITIAGGTVKVKDEVKIEFTIVTGTAPRQQ